METENTKPINNKHAGTSQGDIAVDVPSPIPLHETDADPKAPAHNPSLEENLSPAFEQSSEMQCPPIQTMGPTTPPGYDPTRIPTSIFSTKVTNPAEWSVTSNESLFSIHMGNNSFSRDYAILFGKSGDVQDWNGSELPRLDEWTNNNSNNAIPKSCELIGLPPVMEGEENTSQNVDPGVKVEKHEKEVEVVGRAPNVRNAMPAETTSLTTSSSPPLEKHKKEKVVHDEVFNSPTDIKKSMPAERMTNHPPNIPSPPRFSDDSGNSGNSFAFPVLVGDGGKGAESLKVVPEQPEQPELQGQDAKEAPNAPGTRWFSFLVCWPRCC